MRGPVHPPLLLVVFSVLLYRTICPGLEVHYGLSVGNNVNGSGSHIASDM